MTVWITANKALKWNRIYKICKMLYLKKYTAAGRNIYFAANKFILTYFFEFSPKYLILKNNFSKSIEVVHGWYLFMHCKVKQPCAAPSKSSNDTYSEGDFYIFCRVFSHLTNTNEGCNWCIVFSILMVIVVEMWRKQTMWRMHVYLFCHVCAECACGE